MDCTVYEYIVQVHYTMCTKSSHFQPRGKIGQLSKRRERYVGVQYNLICLCMERCISWTPPPPGRRLSEICNQITNSKNVSQLVV